MGGGKNGGTFCSGSCRLEPPGAPPRRLQALITPHPKIRYGPDSRHRLPGWLDYPDASRLTRASGADQQELAGSRIYGHRPPATAACARCTLPGKAGGLPGPIEQHDCASVVLCRQEGEEPRIDDRCAGELVAWLYFKYPPDGSRRAALRRDCDVRL